MREIKFRAWDGELKLMSSHEDMLLYDHDIVSSLVLPLRRKPVLMQYTGLTDKSGTDVYEGDLLRLPANGYEPREIFEVRYEVGGFYGVWRDQASHQRKEIWGEDLSEYEVVGNIYENPDLLKRETQSPRLTKKSVSSNAFKVSDELEDRPS